ncbi:hypothetical protein PACTADRAFT_41578 [Pachysolen tannophilus NRRL Y-2460]|uniref:Uncharacterized protein n=1 Tax=Pachysolen tannophilus NRRL Y-2460 TaxID=669874 RepID=A0A1E4TX68_PACTA|nr:hypothetical protein PACTADRAFT_41578 [Pachysolen tannophilus NRRL Y-2460]
MVDDSIKVYLKNEILESQEAINFVKSPEAGAIIFFGGTTRNNFESKIVTKLSYEAHHKLALKTIIKIAQTAKKNFADESVDKKIHKIFISHRLGVVPVSEESIIIALSSTHREEGWQAAMFILEEIKKKAEIWKNEIYEDGSSSWKENENSNVLIR